MAYAWLRTVTHGFARSRAHGYAWAAHGIRTITRACCAWLRVAYAYLRMVAHGCAWLHMVAHGCARLRMAAHG
eukprot:2322934-Lingulodinium_polyedra.AAC.1